MATTKTLTPTNQAITLAEFTEKPDNRTNVTNDDKLGDAINALNSNISSEAGGVPVRLAGVISPGGTLTIPISSQFSSNEGFALVCLNISGNAIGGCELLFLGKGSGKKKALIGAMTDTLYSLSYAYTTRGEWTITNNASDSAIFYTALISK